MTVSQGTSGLKVFVSYSRKDLDFAQRIVAALTERGVSCKIDTRDLPKLEDWRRELMGFIREADAVVFIVSQHSIASPVCAWEVEQVAKLNKRLAPIVLQRVDDDRIPPDIAKLNYIFFDPPHSFADQVDALVRALRTNLIWVKEHSRLGELAHRWEGRQRSSRFTLRGQDLRDAERWIKLSPPDAPQATLLQKHFIEASRARANRHRRLLVASVAVAAIVVIGVTPLPAGPFSSWVVRHWQAGTKQIFDVKGATSLKLSPHLTWQAENVTIRNPTQPEQPFLQVGEVSATVSWTSLLASLVKSQPISIDQVIFQRPVFRLHENKGTNQERPHRLPSRTPFSIKGTEFVVKEGYLVYGDKNDNSVGPIHATSESVREDGSAVLRLTFPVNRVEFRGMVDLNSLTSLLDGTPTRISVFVEDGRTTLSLEADCEYLERPTCRIRASTDLFEVDRYLHPSSDAMIKLEPSAGRRYDYLVAHNTLKEFLRALDAGKLSGAGPAKSVPRQTDKIDTEHTKVDLSWLKAIDLELEAIVKRLKIGDYALAMPGGILRLHNGKLSARANLVGSGAKIEVHQATLESQEKGAAYTLYVRSAGIDAAEVTRVVDIRNFVSGGAEVMGVFSGFLRSGSSLLDQLHGRFEAIINDGVVVGFNLNHWWRFLDGKPTSSDAVFTPFDRLTARLHLDYGRVSDAHVKLDTPLIRAEARIQSPVGDAVGGDVDIDFKPIGWRFAGKVCCAWDAVRLEPRNSAVVPPPAKVRPVIPLDLEDRELSALIKKVLNNPSARNALGSETAGFLQELLARLPQ